MRAILAFTAAVCLAPTFGGAMAQDWATGRLQDSPRHHEWVEVPAGEGRTVRSFVAYPERDAKALAVIVLHENRGLTDWVRLFADQLAARGYVAVAPDLLSGFDAEHPHTGAFADSDAAREAIYQLDADRVLADLTAVQGYAAGLPAASGKTAVVGFCWGGAQSFRFAGHAEGLAAALVFYGTAPTDEALIAAVAAPVHGFYGENDERVNATIPETRRAMEAHGKTYDVEIYPGAGHAFMRQADDPEGPEAAKDAARRAWERMERILSAIE